MVTILMGTVLVALSATGTLLFVGQGTLTIARRFKGKPTPFTAAIPALVMSTTAAVIITMISRSFKVTAISLMAILLYWIIVGLHRHRKVASHRAAVKRDIPTLLDYLVLQVESGHALQSALKTAPSIFKPATPLYQSLTELDDLLKIGETTQSALAKMISSMNSPESEVPFQAIASALRHGTPMGVMLREQSARLREQMILDGEQFANTASIKILVPLLFFIFPAAFLVIFSPVIISLSGQLP
jgi:tight adherence protein C